MFVSTIKKDEKNTYHLVSWAFFFVDGGPGDMAAPSLWFTSRTCSLAGCIRGGGHRANLKMLLENVLSSFQTPNHVTCICHVEMNLGQFRTPLLSSYYYELDFASLIFWTRLRVVHWHRLRVVQWIWV